MNTQAIIKKLRQYKETDNTSQRRKSLVILSIDESEEIADLLDKVERLKNTETVKIEEVTDLSFEDTDQNEEYTNATVYECQGCHWRFVADCFRFDYGYTEEYTEIPNYCPMCGKKISDEIEGSGRE